MRSHPIRGEEICRPMKSLWPVLPIIRNHHERWDGSGYLDGLEGEDIPLLPRDLQAADIYDALINEGPYNPALSHEQTFALMEEEVRRGRRDSELVTLFVSVIQTKNAADLAAIDPSLANMSIEVSSRINPGPQCRPRKS